MIQNLQEFEKKFLKSTKTQYITLIFFFDDFDSAYSSLLKHISSLISNNEAVDFFYCVAEEKDNSIYNEKFTLKRPFFVVFHGANKFLEMRLNLSEIDFEEIMIKIQKETESSLDDPNYQSENDEFNNNEINSNRDDSETKSVFLVFLKKMMDSEIISDLEFYYLKCLFLENSMDFPQIIFSHLE